MRQDHDQFSRQLDGLLSLAKGYGEENAAKLAKQLKLSQAIENAADEVLAANHRALQILLDVFDTNDQPEPITSARAAEIASAIAQELQWTGH